MHKTLIVGTLAAFLAAPTLANAQEPAAGAATGATAGAIAGAIVGGPIGAVVGAGIGGTFGAAAADANSPRVYYAQPPVTDGYAAEIEPQVDRRVYVTPQPRARYRSCVEHADGTRVCETVRR